MKRYKDCELKCIDGQSPDELLDVIEQVSISKGYELKRYSTMGDNDTIGVYLKEDGFPFSRLVMSRFFKENSISITNIVPMPESGTSHIDCTTYNKMLDLFRDDVFDFIKEKYGNEIVENNEDYTIQEIIPTSYNTLNAWLSAYPLSGHPLDTKRWYAFVVSLHRSGEELSLDDFENYIKENYNWEDKVLRAFSIKLESELELLSYYDEH